MMSQYILTVKSCEKDNQDRWIVKFEEAQVTGISKYQMAVGKQYKINFVGHAGTSIISSARLVKYNEED